MAGRAVVDTVFAHGAYTWISKPVPAPGLVTLHDGYDGPGRRLAHHAGHTARWLPAPVPRTLGEATRVAWEPGVDAVAVALDVAGRFPAAGLVGLALAVADDLTITRQGLLGRVQPAITQAVPPVLAPPSGYRDLPHLISVYTAAGGRTDRVVWELVPESLLPVLLDGPLPAEPVVQAVHARLRRWLTLRAQARTGQLPLTPLGRFVQLLASVRPLTMSMIYRHAPTLLRLAHDEETA